MDAEQQAKYDSLPPTHKALYELLADIEHKRWSKWHIHVRNNSEIQPDGSLLVPAGLVARWDWLSDTPYNELSSKDQQGDRRQVAKYWSLLEELLSDWR